MAGKLYQGRNPAMARSNGRVRSARRRAARIEAGLCTKCGMNPPEPGRRVCEPCLDKRRKADRAEHAARVARGQCVKCPRAALAGKTSCELHGKRTAPEAISRKNAQARERYRARRRARACTHCGAPSGTASRCEPCAARSHSNALHRQAAAGYDPDAPGWYHG